MRNRDRISYQKNKYFNILRNFSEDKDYKKLSGYLCPSANTQYEDTVKLQSNVAATMFNALLSMERSAIEN